MAALSQKAEMTVRPCVTTPDWPMAHYPGTKYSVRVPSYGPRIPSTFIGSRVEAVGLGEFDIEAAFATQDAELEKLRKAHEESLKWRKVATYATVAGAIFAMIRLTDIYLAVKRRRTS